MNPGRAFTRTEPLPLDPVPLDISRHLIQKRAFSRLLRRPPILSLWTYRTTSSRTPPPVAARDIALRTGRSLPRGSVHPPPGGRGDGRIRADVTPRPPGGSTRESFFYRYSASRASVISSASALAAALPLSVPPLATLGVSKLWPASLYTLSS